MKKKTIIILIFLLVVMMFMPLLSLELNAQRQYPRLVDNAGLLDSSEAKSLVRKLDEISEEHNFDVVIVTEESIGGAHPRDYADDFFDYNGYGMGKDYDGVILLLSMEERDWAISTNGYGIVAFTDAGLKFLEDEVIVYFKKDKFYKGFNSFSDRAAEFIEQAKSGQPYDKGNLPKRSLSSIWIAISLGVGSLVSTIGTGSMKSDLKSVSKSKKAVSYMNLGVAGISNVQDRFLYSQVSRSPRAKESSSGGSTTHTSSSGRTHGGRSGKF